MAISVYRRKTTRKFDHRDQTKKEDDVVLEAYRKHVEERAQDGVVAQPLNAEQVAALVELLKNPPAGEESTLIDLLENRIPLALMKPLMSKLRF